MSRRHPLRHWLAVTVPLVLLAGCASTVTHQAAVQERSPVLAAPNPAPVRSAPAATSRSADKPVQPRSGSVDKAVSGTALPPSAGARTGTADPVAVATPLRADGAAVPVQVGMAGSARPAPPATAAVVNAPPGAAVPAANPAVNASPLQWVWPVDAAVSQAFSEALKGLDFAAALGTPVRAAAAGTVSFVGSSLRGYGRMVVLKHDHGYISVYAHNREVHVKEGQRVNRGQVIAEMGNSDSEAVVLHFEVRHLGKPVDPTGLLPVRSPAEAQASGR